MHGDAWKLQQIGVGVSRCPVDLDHRGPSVTNMGYVEPRESDPYHWVAINDVLVTATA